MAKAFTLVCAPSCRSYRCPAARERMAVGWRNGGEPEAGKPCRDYFNCRWPECDCTKETPCNKGSNNA